MKIEKKDSKEKFSCRRNELTIRGHVWGCGAAPKPAVILSHGFLGNEKMCHTYAKLLAELGYVTFTFDFCGGGLGSRSDGKSENMTLLTEKADLLAVIDYVKKCPCSIRPSVSRTTPDEERCYFLSSTRQTFPIFLADSP